MMRLAPQSSWQGKQAEIPKQDSLNSTALVCFGLLALTACSCSKSADGNNSSPFDVPPDVQTALVVGDAAIKASLKDPDSAKFQGRFVSKAGSRYVFCGEVNAKNGFGGYNGFRRFIVDQKDKTVIIDGEAPAFDLAWSGECAEPVFTLDK